MDPISQLTTWAVTHPEAVVIISAFVFFFVFSVFISLVTLWLTRP